MLVLALLAILSLQRVTSLELDVVYNATVQQGDSWTLHYAVNTNGSGIQTIKLIVTSPNAGVDRPVFVSVRQQLGVTSWQIPFLDRRASYYEVGHTICPTLNNPPNEAASSFNVTIDIASSSTEAMEVFVVARPVRNFVLRLNEPVTLSVTTSTPAYYAYHFTSDVERVLVKVRSAVSTEDICAVASIQVTTCPSDGVNSELFSVDGSFQSMRSLAAITTSRPDQDFFYIVIAVFNSTSSDCRVSDSRGGLHGSVLTDSDDFLFSRLNLSAEQVGPAKNVTIVIEKASTNYAVPIIVSLVVFLVFYGGAFLGVLFFDCFLFSGHWIHEWNKLYRGEDESRGSSSGESDNQIDGDVERGLTMPRARQQGNRTHYMYSSNFKRRPSLKKVILGTHLDHIKETVMEQMKSSDRRGRTNQIEPTAGPPAEFDLTQSLELGHEQPRAKSLDDLTQSLPIGFIYKREQTMPAVVSPGSTENELEASLGQSSVVSQVTSEATSRMNNEVNLQDQQQRVVTPSQVGQINKTSEEAFEEVHPSSPKSTDIRIRDDTPSSIVSATVSPVPAPVASPTPSARSFSPKRTAEQWLVKTLADVYICEGEEEQTRYRRYFWHLFTISVFYGLPAFQLILTYQQLLHITGNQDICYYNYLCSRQLGVLSAFNNIWSNIGYVALGLLFILMALRRHSKYRTLEMINQEKTADQTKTGVPQHFGIYYTIGWALVAEGFMSAFYHVCPNDTNFQFDTAFMFAIAGLGIYQIFHNRHPEFSPNAHILYFSFAVLIIVSFIGSLYPSAGVWIVMTILYLVSVLFASFQFYYNGIIRLGNKAVLVKVVSDAIHSFPSKPASRVKFCFVIVVNIVNLGLALYGLISYFTSPLEFNSFVLAVMIVNFTLYLFYYLIVKSIYKENNCQKQNPPTMLFVYLAIAVICWIPALVFFRRPESDWALSPARSRDGNEDCVLLDFFNSHDVWHFLSAFALFFSFLMLMSLDDNREDVPRNELRVF